MKKILIIITLFLKFTLAAQHEHKNNNFFLDVHKGVFFDFNFKNLSFTEHYPSSGYIYHPLYEDHLLYIKLVGVNAIGTSFSIGFFHRIWDKAIVGISYSRTIQTSKKTINYKFYGFYPAEINIYHARITIINNFYEVVYKRNIHLKNNFYWELGGYFINPICQGIIIDVDRSTIYYEETTGFNFGKFLSFGFFAGIEKILLKSKNFELGINTRVYYTLFDDFWEGIQLNLITRYNF